MPRSSSSPRPQRAYLEVPAPVHVGDQTIRRSLHFLCRLFIVLAGLDDDEKLIPVAEALRVFTHRLPFGRAGTEEIGQVGRQSEVANVEIQEDSEDENGAQEVNRVAQGQM